MNFDRVLPAFLMILVLLLSDRVAIPNVANATRTSKRPTIDGDVLGDSMWESAQPVTGFWQTAPYEGEAASEKTEVRILYDEDAIYFGVICYDRNPAGIVVSESRRDAPLNETDSFQIVLDTYADKQNGFLFGTNPAGIEYDAQITNEGQGSFGSGSGGFNLNWDGSWEVKTAISDSGWSAEFAIPFRTIRFSSEESQTWGLNFQRNIRRRNERAFWTKLPRQFDLQKISMAGSLVGLEAIQPKNLKVIPYTLTGVSKDFQIDHTNYRRNLGFDVKYSMTPSLTLDATYNTDFAQVEADEQQINLDRFNLFFPEKRPFFLENAGSFSVGSPGEVQLFFSRRIGIEEENRVPIVAGVRLSGKISDVNVGLLNMQTEAVGSKGIHGNNFAVARVNKELPNRSSIGAIFVNRQGTGDLAPDNDYNRSIALDGRLGIGKYGLLSGYAARSFTPGIDADEYAFNTVAEYNSESWLLSAVYTEVSEGFNPEVGFLRRKGFRSPQGTIFRRIRPKNLLGFLEIRPHTSYQGYWNFDGVQESGHWHIDSHWEWKNGYEIHTGINFTHEHLDSSFTIFPGVDVQPGTYDHAETQLVVQTNQGEWWSFSVRSFIGGFFGGKRFNVEPSLRFRVGETFNVECNLSHNDINLPVGDFVTNLFQSRISYSFTPHTFLQALFQINDRADISALNLRFGWQRQANTGLFIVYDDSRNIANSRWGSQFRSVVVKYSHLFDLLR